MRMLFLILTLLCSTATASLLSKFRHYEEIHSHEIKIREKRHLSNTNLRFKLVNFHALGKKFQLQLFPDSKVFSHDLKVHLVDAVGKTERAEVNTDGLYSGYERGKTGNKVHAVNDDNLWYFYIWTKDDIFIVEPVTRLDPQRPGSILIAYKSSDLLTNSTTCHNCKTEFCKASISKQKNINQEQNIKKSFSIPKNAENPNIRKSQRRTSSNILTDGPTKEKIVGRSIGRELFEKESARTVGNEPDLSREVRDTSDEPDTCGLFVVVDYNTFRGVGRESPVAIVKWLSHLLKIVDSVLRNSGLAVNGVTYGVKMKRLMIHKEFTSTDGGHLHYNMKNNTMTETQTLSSFSENQNFANCCLAHLITQRTFRGALGHAYIPTAKADDPHGICGEDNLNAGLTTTIDASGRPLPIEMHVLTLAHELGHSFGAHHDQEDDPRCSPDSEAGGGKFLMFPVSGAQRGANRQHFSPCSLAKMKDVVLAKAQKCFELQKTLNAFCGDGIVGPDEDCDFGLFDEQTNDKCCTSKCRFRPGAVCSPDNHPCCTKNCQVAPKTKSCVHDVANGCLQDSLCDGNDAFSCPKPKHKADGSPCGDAGTCWQGDCLTFCENLGRKSSPTRKLESCNCDHNTTMMCRLCCKVKDSHDCSPMGGTMKNGTSCLQGVCSQGVCGSELKVKTGKIMQDIEELKDDIVSGKTSTLTIVFVFIACAGAFSMFVGTLFSSGQTIPQRKFSGEEEMAIEELREMLEKTIGHLNRSNDDEINPTTQAIAQQLYDEKRRIRAQRKGKALNDDSD